MGGLDQRGWNSPETLAKKSASGKKSKNGGIHSAPKRNKSREEKLLDRIELVVRMAESNGTVVGNSQDVVRHNRSRLLFRSLHAVKIG